MPNNSALALYSDINKKEYNENTFYQISPKMFQKINEKIEGKSGNQRSLLLYLIFQQQNSPETFRPAEKTILESCSFVHSAYVTARKGLVEKGLIDYIPNQSITINYKKIMEE